MDCRLGWPEELVPCDSASTTTLLAALLAASSLYKEKRLAPPRPLPTPEHELVGVAKDTFWPSCSSYSRLRRSTRRMMKMATTTSSTTPAVISARFRAKGERSELLPLLLPLVTSRAPWLLPVLEAEAVEEELESIEDDDWPVDLSSGSLLEEELLLLLLPLEGDGVVVAGEVVAGALLLLVALEDSGRTVTRTEEAEAADGAAVVEAGAAVVAAGAEVVEEGVLEELELELPELEVARK
ncbi:hypothetical protein BBJ28_00006605 [Nothophytophthora sp. Chile5]|nr:hypothetical protein BBJ28_00006605 [Nothophytophthora sp. Chile5]